MNKITKRIIRDSAQKCRLSLIVILIITLAAALVTGVAPIVFGDSIEGILGPRGLVRLSFTGLRWLILLAVASLLVQGLTQIFQRLYKKSFLEYWVPRMAEKISTMEYEDLTSMEVGYVNKRLTSEIQSVPELFTKHAPQVIKSILVITLSVVMLFKLLPYITIVLIAAVLVIVPLGLLVLRRAKGLMSKIVETWSRFEGTSTDFIAAQFQIRAYAASVRMTNYISNKLSWATKTDLHNSLKIIGLIFLLIGTIMFGLVAFLYFIEDSPRIASARAGTVVAFLGYVWILAAKSASLSGVIGNMQQSLVKLHRMGELLEKPGHQASSKSYAPRKVEFVEISRLASKVDGQEVFSNLNICMNSGEILAIYGQSGCGKTTLLRTLFGFNKRSKGKILVNNKEVLGLMELGLNAVYVPQEVRFFSGCLRWNMEMLSGVKFSDDRLSDVLSQLKLDDRLDAALACTTDLKEAGSNLSGGEKQRLALAAVVLRSPNIVLLDEPTAHVDGYTEQIVLKTIRQMANEGSMIFVVAHSRAVRSLSTRAVNLENYNHCKEKDLRHSKLSLANIRE
ncbi:ATP-binding cassette domain-containing protein [Candidatus Fermentibacteria bacterium]|nr:ATP-binding cassette domain-containing protein [Candidatus Fermentibacteria bacterium]